MEASVAKHQNVVFAVQAVAIVFLLCLFTLCLAIPCTAHAATDGAVTDGATLQAGSTQELTTQASAKKVTLYVDSATQKSKTLKATGLKAKKATWKTSNAKVVTVKAGKATAKKAGKATVTAKQGSKKFTFNITVKKVSINKKSATLKPGGTLALTLTGDKIASAKSSKENVASVTKAGKVTAKNAGKATITLKSKKGKKYTCAIKVNKLTTLEEGLGYWFGINGKTFNTNKARAAFQKAADDGNAEAWYWLGNVRRYDQDADRWPEVLSFYQKAVVADSAYGYYGLGTLFETGYGVDKDVQKAIDNDIAVDGTKAKDFYTRALASSDFQTRNAARIGLGDMYRYGWGVAVDEAKAVKLYKAAADEGYYLGCRHMGDTYRSGNGLVEPDAAKMLSWYKKEAAGGSAYSLGEVYLNGIGIDADPTYAREIFQEALDAGDRSAAMCMCGFVQMNANGVGMSKNKTAAIDWCYKAIDASGPFDDSDNPDDRLRKPLPYARYVLQHYNQPLVRS